MQLVQLMTECIIATVVFVVMVTQGIGAVFFQLQIVERTTQGSLVASSL